MIGKDERRWKIVMKSESRDNRIGSFPEISLNRFHPHGLLDFEGTTGIAMAALETIRCVFAEFLIMGSSQFVADPG